MAAAFEFFRDEALNARNYLQTANTETPEFRRNQFGGVLGGPIVTDRTFFFADYQGQRQTIGRTVISTVPTALQRQGIFTESIGGRVPADLRSGNRHRRTRAPFANGTIPEARWDPVAKALLARYPLPTSTGTANNYRRTGDETVDQNQWSGRLDQRLSAGEQVFARLAHFLEDFTPVTPLPDGSGTTTGTLGPQHTSSWSFATAYQNIVYRRGCSMNCGLAIRAAHVDRSAATLASTASSASAYREFRRRRGFRIRCRRFSVAGYQQLGSPANTASDFGTSVTEIADSLTWLKGRHAVKFGADLRWERLNVVQPASPTGLVHLCRHLHRPARRNASTGSPLASFLLGQVSHVLRSTCSNDVIRNRAHIQEYFRAGRLACDGPAHRECRCPLHAQFPVV